MKHPPYEDCSECHGEGKLEVTIRQKGQLYGHKEKMPCWKCNGRGRVKARLEVDKFAFQDEGLEAQYQRQRER